jgi:hypothetical protein
VTDALGAQAAAGLDGMKKDELAAMAEAKLADVTTIASAGERAQRLELRLTLVSCSG